MIGWKGGGVEVVPTTRKGHHFFWWQKLVIPSVTAAGDTNFSDATVSIVLYMDGLRRFLSWSVFCLFFVNFYFLVR